MVEKKRLASARRIAPGAREACFRGRYELNKWSEEGLTKSIEYFQESVQKDPGYAEAWAGLSDAYSFLSLFGIQPAQEALPKAKAAALKALELDETLSEAHVSLASVMLHGGGSWSAAGKELQRAIALNPNNAVAHQFYGYQLTAGGRFGDAIAEMERARELDPLSPNTQNALGAAFYWAGHYDEALQEFRQVPDPDLNSERRHRRMATIYERKGMQREAIAELLTALRFADKQELAEKVERKYLSSGYSEAKKLFLRGDLRETQLRAERNHVQTSAVWIAADYALQGEKNKTFEWLEKAFQEGDGGLIYLKVDQEFETLRSDPRFQDLLRRMGLPS